MTNSYDLEVEEAKKMSNAELEAKICELESKHSIGFTFKRDLALVNEPPSPYLIESVNRKLRQITQKDLENDPYSFKFP